MQAVHVWLFSCFSTQVSLICPFFIYFSVLFSKKVKFSLPQKTYFQNYIRDIRKVLLKRCSMYVGVGRERINSIQEKRGWTQWITMTWQPFDFCISVLTLFISRNAFFFPTMLFQGCTLRETWNQGCVGFLNEQNSKQVPFGLFDSSSSSKPFAAPKQLFITYELPNKDRLLKNLFSNTE